MELIEAIKETAARAGYDSCGIATTDEFVEFKNAVQNMIRRFPENTDLYSNMLKRVNPEKHTPWAKSIVTCVRFYGKHHIPPGLEGHIGRTYLFDRRNPACPDHTMPKKMKEGLKQLGLRVKQGGVPDRWAAARAGLTHFGKNCFAYSDKGSWINIETWLIDAKLPQTGPTTGTACPEGCRKCIDACPTKALIEPYIMKMDRCVAYLSYASPEPVSDELWNKMGKWIYGCDICQEVCPLNKDKWRENEKALWLESIAPYLQPEMLAEMNQEIFETIIHPAFWYIPKENISRWHANAKRALE